MSSHQFLFIALLFLAAAVVAVPLFKRVGLGSVLGYLAAGALLGPAWLHVVNDPGSVRRFSEIGVVLLMFVIGLELLPRRLWEMRAHVFGLGAAQVIGTGAVLGGIARAALGERISWPAALVVGLGLALSSTAFAVQALAERNELITPHGRKAFAILLFQDLAVIPLLAALPMLGTRGAAPVTSTPIWISLSKGAGAVLGVVVCGRFVLRPVFRLVAGARSQEALTATALAVVVGSALAMDAVGLSMAFGAFLAGVLLADSEYRDELEADIEPFRGLLMGLFFMSVGMSVSPRVVEDHPLQIAGAVVVLLAVKIATGYIIARLSRTAPDGARRLAIATSQGGEFAFVLFAAAAGQGIITRDFADLLVVVVTFSMMATPLALAIDDRWRRRRALAPKRVDGPLPMTSETDVLIAGFGRFGQVVARILAVRRIPFTALDPDPEHIAFVSQFGSKVHFGDASRLDVLRAAKADRARLFVLAIDNVETSMKAAELVKKHFPNLEIFARARNRAHAYRLLELGVEVANRETFFSSLEMARRVLIALGLPDSTANETVRIFRDHDEKQVLKAAHYQGDLAKLKEIASEGRRELESLFEQDLR